MIGSKTRKKNRRILEIQKELSGIKSGQGGKGAKRRALKGELKSLGYKTDKEKAREDRKTRSQYDRDYTIKNKRGRVTGYKEGYDPSKGIKGLSSDKSSKSSKSKSKATMTGKERAQQMARDRIAAKKAGTYKKPKTAQELAKERLEKKNKPTKTRGRVR